MGRYLNPGNAGFASVRGSEYVDKSGLVAEVNRVLGGKDKLVCVSRARRFGKSYASKMLAAYYDRSCDSHPLFDDLAVAKDPSYERHLNKYDVIYVDMTALKGELGDASLVQAEMVRRISEEVLEAYPGLDLPSNPLLSDILLAAVLHTGVRFVFVVDEWDVLIRETSAPVADAYVQLLRSLFKDSGTTDRIFAGVYLTGILPIKKYGTHSAISDFRAFTMVDQAWMAPYLGFTSDEVRDLCQRHGVDFAEMRRWYDGYSQPSVGEVYNPNSVMEACKRKRFKSYWPQTEAYEALRLYVDMDFDGLQQALFELLGGGTVKIDPASFQNDMTSLACRDDVLTLLVHLGYLAFDIDTSRARVPNEEVRQEFARTLKKSHREELAKIVRNSDLLLQAVQHGEADMVARMVAEVHDSSAAPIWYNDEQSLRYVVKLALISAVDEYLRVEELPGGQGYADLVYIPKKGSPLPLLVVELKWDKQAEAAIGQIRERNYPAALRDWGGDVLLVGISYDSRTKEHSCTIEQL